MSTKTIKKTVELESIDASLLAQNRSSSEDEYEIYLRCANDGKGGDRTTGKKLKTYDEWLTS